MELQKAGGWSSHTDRQKNPLWDENVAAETQQPHFPACKKKKEETIPESGDAFHVCVLDKRVTKWEM